MRFYGNSFFRADLTSSNTALVRLVPRVRYWAERTWEQRKLDELATFGGGHTPSMADNSNYADDGILWVTSQDVKVDYLEDTTTKLSKKGASELKLYAVGTLLMVTRSGILRHTLPISMLRKPSTVNQDIRTINTNDECSSLWLMQYLKARSKNLLLEYGKTGTTVESIDFAKMKSMSLMLPEPSEQEALGQLFYKLDNLRLERLSTQMQDRPQAEGQGRLTLILAGQGNCFHVQGAAVVPSISVAQKAHHLGQLRPVLGSARHIHRDCTMVGMRVERDRDSVVIRTRPGLGLASAAYNAPAAIRRTIEACAAESPYMR
ncbi:MAG: restriction endonuclease subunit S [Parafannyhessea umbonata]|nr:restriction endonuclease subunit S [Parafannyhessea umbonata]